MSIHPADYSHGGHADPAPAAAGGAGAQEGAAIRLDPWPLAGLRIDRALAQALGSVSRTRIQRWMALGAVAVDGAAVLPSYRVRGIETIEVWPLPTEAERAFAPDAMPLAVVYEDAQLLVVDKPAGLVTHPAPGHWRGTLMNGLLHARPDSAQLPRAGIVHRLDRDTSGLLMVARTERAFEHLSAELAARRVSRRYLAVAEGATWEAARIDAPVGRDPRDRLRMAVVAHGKPAVTHVAPLARGQGVTAVECRLETGRTHQIRVHLAHHGHPLVGDRLYGGRPRGSFARQALHAWNLALTHPLTGERLTVHSPLPADLLELGAGCAIEPWPPRSGHSG